MKIKKKTDNIMFYRNSMIRYSVFQSLQLTNHILFIFFSKYSKEKNNENVMMDN